MSDVPISPMTTVQLAPEAWALVFGLLAIVVQTDGTLAIGLLKTNVANAARKLR